MPSGLDASERALVLTERLVSEAVDCSDELVAFADEFATEPRRRNEAIVLKMRQTRTQNPERRVAIRKEMSELVAQIAAEYRGAESAEKIAAQHRLLEERQQDCLAAGRPNELVFSSEQLRKRFSKGGFELGPVSLELRQGEITGLVGQNAHGKTTLLRMIAGELKQDEGSLCYPTLEGSRTKHDWVLIKSRIAYVPQVLTPWRGSLRENLHFHAAIHGVRGSANVHAVEFIVERLSLGRYLNQRWDALSGGYKLRFALAAALAWKPSLLVLDEPLANLDIIAQTALLDDLRALANSLANPMAIILSSQHLHELEAVCDNLLFLRGGTVIYNGALSAVGEGRLNNIFELGTPLSLAAVRGTFPRDLVETVQFNGVSFVLKTTRQVIADDILRHLLDAGIHVKYFRDISRSVKQLFE